MQLWSKSDNNFVRPRQIYSVLKSHYPRVILGHLVWEKYRECSFAYKFIRYLSRWKCFYIATSPINGIKSSFQVCLMNTFTLPVMSILTMPVMQQKATFIKHVLGPTLHSKKTTSALAVDYWRQLPSEMKNLSNFNLRKKSNSFCYRSKNKTILLSL